MLIRAGDGAAVPASRGRKGRAPLLHGASDSSALTSPGLFLPSASFPLPSSAANMAGLGKREVERAHLD